MRHIDAYFHTLEKEREEFYRDMGISPEGVWKSPQAEKWSVGETVYHLYLLARLIRRVSVFYVPIALPVAYLRRGMPYATTIHDIYKTYREEKNKPMPAPSILIPPTGLKDTYNFSEVQNLLDVETKRWKQQLSDMTDDIAGHIKYPDPIAAYPNVIQSVQLLGIHEKHHFQIVKNYVYE